LEAFKKTNVFLVSSTTCRENLIVSQSRRNSVSESQENAPLHQPKVMKVRMWLWVGNNRKFVREKGRTREETGGSCP
jgi:hypothetical protein